MLVASFGACGDDDGGEAVDVTLTCDRLEDLAEAIADATSAEDVRRAVEGPARAFRDAASSSGDERLAELAETYMESLDVYLTSAGIDAREAGNNADVALDRSGERCAQLGATNTFPTNP